MRSIIFMLVFCGMPLSARAFVHPNHLVRRSTNVVGITNRAIRFDNAHLYAATTTKQQPSNEEEFTLGHFKLYDSRNDCWRPTVEDVERISWGKPAKKKRTGSRGVPHRLNSDERKLFDQARRKGFLELVGSGWRSQRRDAPLANTYRSLCDARGQVSIVLYKKSSGLDDEISVDLSPLRLPESFDKIASACGDLSPLGEDGPFIKSERSWATDDHDSVDDDEAIDDDPWGERPIYQLSPYCLSWELPRSDAKQLGKQLAAMFKTVEKKATKSRKPIHVKPGKNRRSGGYGIG